MSTYKQGFSRHGGSLYYPGNFEHDILAQNKKRGIPIIFTTRDKKVIDFVLSDENWMWQKEVNLILKGG